jgi:hypothetical protein
MPASKIDGYIEQRVSGVDPLNACLAAGYSQAGISVTMARLESREDVRLAIRAAKRAAPAVGKSKLLHPLKAPAGKRHYRSVADEPRHGDGPTDPLDPWRLRDSYDSPLDLLRDVMNNPKAPGGLRIQCAKDALPYCHARKEGGKKDDEKSKAKDTAASGKFGTQSKPSHLQRVA